MTALLTVSGIDRFTLREGLRLRDSEYYELRIGIRY
ncbi:hypothetical protein NIES4101_64800 [Calothrix sp. NIES-4101]|nr:hypothetical protein NIES4101_64800 [Calothrix sp. NIES-4101]